MYFNTAFGTKDIHEPTLYKGGILADDMGLGKTIQSLSLVLTDVLNMKENIGISRPTLIVCPVSVIGNWTKQVDSHFLPGFLTYQVLHGNEKSRQIKKINDYDITFTTYGTLSSIFRASRTSRIFTNSWRRVILDEAHIIRTVDTLTYQAALEINAECRWCLTGTPIQNSVR